ncbi:MAG: helix-turn-helix domain-containing protein, partial [Polyangiales bacterium]
PRTDGRAAGGRAPPAVRHQSIVDASRLESGTEATFGLLERYVTKHGSELAEWVTRLAIVRPSGLSGAIVAGAGEVLRLPYPVQIFDDARDALSWLGEDATIATELAAARDEASATPAFLGSLRALLDANLRGMELAAAARKLGLSTRSLQRKLAEIETTFQLEMIDARVRAAKRMLRDPDAPLTRIALESGCASLQHLNTLFKKRTGTLPSAWRKQQA